MEHKCGMRENGAKNMHKGIICPLLSLENGFYRPILSTVSKKMSAL